MDWLVDWFHISFFLLLSLSSFLPLLSLFLLFYFFLSLSSFLPLLSLFLLFYFFLSFTLFLSSSSLFILTSIINLFQNIYNKTNTQNPIENNLSSRSRYLFLFLIDFDFGTNSSFHLSSVAISISGNLT